MNISKSFLLLFCFSIVYHVLYFLPSGILRYFITMLPILILSLYGVVSVILLIFNKKDIPSN